MKDLLIPLSKQDRVPLYEQIYNFIKQQIQHKRISAGEGLPSTRALSIQLGVSRSTVDLAYEQLVSEGYMESIPCKGYYVCEMDELYQIKQEKPKKKIAETAAEPKYRYDFAVNGIDPDGFPQNAWKKISRQVLLEDDGNLFQLGSARGEQGLREAIANYLRYARGMQVDARQIVVGAGNDYLLMLLSVILGRETDIAMENPTYLSARQCFTQLGHRVHAIAMDDAGMMPEALKESQAKVAYVMPAHQFPLGMIMPVKRRNQLLRWAGEQQGRYLIEDDYDSEFRYKGMPIPALWGMDQQDKVVYLGTFSKAIAPAIRISYMVLPQELLQVYRQRAGNFSATVSRVDQRIIEIFLREGYYERHLNKMRALYKTKHDILLHHLKGIPQIRTVEGENAGVHIVLYLQDGFTEAAAVRQAQNARIRVYPMHDYAVDADTLPGQAILLGYATLPADTIADAAAALANAWAQIMSH